MKNGLTIAMPKGRIFNEALHLFRRAGVAVPTDLEESRKLTVMLPKAGLSFFLAKPLDIPTYVEYGAADLGIVGKDILLEAARDVHELLDLQISPCRISVAALPDWQPSLHPRVATKYPRITDRFFRGRGQQVEVIRLNGSIELAPLIGLADRIVDVVSTGQTLRVNGLIEQEEIVQVTSRLIANRASYRMKAGAIGILEEKLAKVVEERGVVL